MKYILSKISRSSLVVFALIFVPFWAALTLASIIFKVDSLLGIENIWIGVGTLIISVVVSIIMASLVDATNRVDAYASKNGIDKRMSDIISGLQVQRWIVLSARCLQAATRTGAKSWFCDPKAPWQKGTVENTNRRLRRYLPRTIDPALLTGRDILDICERMNATPRKCLGYETPAEAFKRHLLASGSEAG